MDRRMDMATASATPINLPLSDPNCNNDTCTAFAAGELASQTQIPWNSQILYGRWTSITYCIILGLFGLAYWMRFTGQPSQRTSSFQKLVAFFRSWLYRRTPGTIISSKSYGVLGFILFSTVFLAIMSFAERPYYRTHLGYGSPPLGVRTGMMAVALTPPIFALPGKVNPVTYITGISHEKLNVLHRYISYLMFILAIIHTVPFIVAPLQDSKGGTAYLASQWAPSYDTSESSEYSGIAPFAILVFLSSFSIPWIRRRAYELFVHSHILAAIGYLAAMFWHVADNADALSCLWATVGIWAFTILARFLTKLKSNNLKGVDAHIEEIDESMLQMTIKTTEVTWNPGQHVFLRFPGLGPLDNHPFTIASSCSETYVVDKDGNSSAEPLRFLIRPYEGITRKLAKYAGSSVKAYIDGPYGHYEPLEKKYENVVLVAGGSGITAMLPHLSYLAKRLGRRECVTEEVRLIWAIKTKNALKWVEEELQEVLDIAPKGTLHIEYFVTSEKFAEESGEKYKDEEAAVGLKGEGVEAHTPGKNFGKGKFGRPDFKTMIPEMLIGRTCVLACGPEGMKIDVSNSVAKCQSKVRKGVVQEVSLRTETFGW